MSEIAILGRGFESLLSALSVVVMTLDRMQMLLSKNTALFARRFA